MLSSSVNSEIKYKVEDFLRDDEFICYALNIPSEAYPKWESLARECSFLASKTERAKAILTGEDMTYTLKPEESDELKRRVFASLSIES